MIGIKSNKADKTGEYLPVNSEVNKNNLKRISETSSNEPIIKPNKTNVINNTSPENPNKIQYGSSLYRLSGESDSNLSRDLPEYIFLFLKRS